ncbi:hypothetical protein BJ546DRAFT_591823 [Cryomyces antarcticus]
MNIPDSLGPIPPVVLAIVEQIRNVPLQYQRHGLPMRTWLKQNLGDHFDHTRGCVKIRSPLRVHRDDARLFDGRTWQYLCNPGVPSRADDVQPSDVRVDDAQYNTTTDTLKATLCDQCGHVAKDLQQCGNHTTPWLICASCNSDTLEWLTDRQLDALRTGALMPLCDACTNQVFNDLRLPLGHNGCTCPTTTGKWLCVGCRTNALEGIAWAKEYHTTHHRGITHAARGLLMLGLMCHCGNRAAAFDGARKCAACDGFSRAPYWDSEGRAVVHEPGEPPTGGMKFSWERDASNGGVLNTDEHADCSVSSQLGVITPKKRVKTVTGRCEDHR